MGSDWLLARARHRSRHPARYRFGSVIGVAERLADPVVVAVGQISISIAQPHEAHVARGKLPRRNGTLASASVPAPGDAVKLRRYSTRAPWLATTHRSGFSVAWTRRDSNPHLRSGKPRCATSYTTGPTACAPLARRAPSRLATQLSRDVRAPKRMLHAGVTTPSHIVRDHFTAHDGVRDTFVRKLPRSRGTPRASRGAKPTLCRGHVRTASSTAG